MQNPFQSSGEQDGEHKPTYQPQIGDALLLTEALSKHQEVNNMQRL